MLREDRVRREDRLGAFGDRQGPCVGRLHNSRGAEFGSGAVLVDKKALPLTLRTRLLQFSRQRHSCRKGVRKICNAANHRMLLTASQSECTFLDVHRAKETPAKSLDQRMRAAGL
jgi:hypothetical protein